VVRAKVEGNDIVRPAGLDEPAPKSQPADLTEILRASVAAVKSGRKDDTKDHAEEAKPAKPRTRRKASA